MRVNDSQLVMLSEKAHYDHSFTGYLHKRTADSAKWQLRWFVLYQVSDIYVDFRVDHPFETSYLRGKIRDVVVFLFWFSERIRETVCVEVVCAST